MADNPPPEEKKLDSFNHNSESTTRRKRTVFTKEQIYILKNYYQKNPYPGIEEREELSSLTNIPEARIHVWFQNRRARLSAQQKKLAPGVSTTLRQVCLEDVSLGTFLEENSEQELAAPNASRCPSWAGEPSQKPSPRSSCSFERRRAASTTEDACVYGHGISQSHRFGPSQTMEPSTELHPCALPRPMSQGSPSQWASSWAPQGTQGPENYNTQTSFYGQVKPPLQSEEQDWTVEQLYSNHPLPFECAEEAPHQLQQPHPQQNCPQQPHPQQNYSHQPSALQPLVPQTPRFQVQPLASSQPQPQELQDQTLPLPWAKEEEHSCESFSSFSQELHCTDVSKGTVGLGSTLLLPDGHPVVPKGTCAPQEHLPAPQGHLADPLGNQADHQRHLTDTQGQLPAPPGPSG